MRVAISIKQFEPANIDADQMAIPIISPRGPAFVSGPPIETKSAAPIARYQHTYFLKRFLNYLQRWR
jgi:hypothetical protein